MRYAPIPVIDQTTPSIERVQITEKTNNTAQFHQSPEGEKLLQDLQTIDSEKLIDKIRGGSDLGPFCELIGKFVLALYGVTRVQRTRGFSNSPLWGSNRYIGRYAEADITQDQFINKNAPSSWKKSSGNGLKSQGLKSQPDSFSEETNSFNEEEQSQSILDVANEVSQGTQYKCTENYQTYRAQQEAVSRSSTASRMEFTTKSVEDIKALMFDDQRGGYTRSSIDEAWGICQAEAEGTAEGSFRFTKEQMDQHSVDFGTKGPGLVRFVDLKEHVSQRVLDAQGQNRSLADAAFESGQKIMKQKQDWTNYTKRTDWSPRSIRQIRHNNDLWKLDSQEEVDIVKENLMKGARDQAARQWNWSLDRPASDYGITWQNDD